MSIPTEADIVAAHAEAQRRFSEMVAERSYAEPDHPATIAYISAERHVDDLLADAQFGAQESRRLALGDHFVFPAGPGR